MIDYIYFTATSTDSYGESIIQTAEYYVPFFNFLVVFLVLLFGLLVVKFFYKLVYITRDPQMEIKNRVYLSKKGLNSFFD